MELYLDIDGVLIRDGQPTLRYFRFLRWAVAHHQPHWLTTRDAHGSHDGILRAFRLALGVPVLPRETEALLRAVRPTEWQGSKLTGIDLASDFLWIDDNPRPGEIEGLRARGLLDRLLVVTPRDTHPPAYPGADRQSRPGMGIWPLVPCQVLDPGSASRRIAAVRAEKSNMSAARSTRVKASSICISDLIRSMSPKSFVRLSSAANSCAMGRAISCASNTEGRAIDYRFANCNGLKYCRSFPQSQLARPGQLQFTYSTILLFYQRGCDESDL